MIKILHDTHIHTIFSSDSRMTIDETINTSKNLNIGITIVEHMDFDYPKIGQFVFDKEEYFKKYTSYRSDTVLLGMELGMRTECIKINKEVSLDDRFDYIVGSIHVVNGIDVYEKDFYNGGSKKEVYNQYFQAMINSLKEHYFINSLGHIDYIARYSRFPDKEVYYDEFKEQFDKVLSILAQREQALEINTRRFDNKAAIENFKKILKRFKKCGIIFYYSAFLFYVCGIISAHP